MMNSQIEEVKNKTDIVSLISEYIEVKKAGRNYKANCPFHGEKTPSFMITPELQMYKCFGCGKSGDVFTFLEDHEGMDFKDALTYLAEKAGVELEHSKNEGYSEKEKLLEINLSALNFYNYALHDHPQGKRALLYLKKDRGFKNETVRLFKIGYSPESFNAFFDYLTKKKKYQSGDLLKSGLFVGKSIDRFRGRIVFPLFDHRGKVLGFSGRILPWQKNDMAKYINSPDTLIYHKSNILYGMDLAKSEIRIKRFVVIVEGEIDMISSYQAGIKNVVAIKGSALTENQLRLISRFCQTIILCLDADFAGNEAAKKGSILAVNMGFDVKVAKLSDGYKDPDEIAKKSPEDYKKAIDEATTLWDFLIDNVFKKYDSGTGYGKAKISKELIPLLKLIQDKIVQSFYVEVVSRKLSVPNEAVLVELSKTEDTALIKNKNEKNMNTIKNRRTLLEEKLLVNAIDDIKKIPIELISTEFIVKVINYLKNNTFPLPKELEPGYAEMLLENSEREDVSLIIKELTVLDIKQRLEILGNKIKLDENNQELLSEFNVLTKKLYTL